MCSEAVKLRRLINCAEVGMGGLNNAADVIKSTLQGRYNTKKMLDQSWMAARVF